MQTILRRLLDRLDTIAEQHDEVGDTEVREAMWVAVFDGFIRPLPDFALPSRYAMFNDEGDRLVQQALAEFMPAACGHAAGSGLVSFHERLSAFQNGDVRSAVGTYHDDYFGWANPEGFDASGVVIARHKA